MLPIGGEKVNRPPIAYAPGSPASQLLALVHGLGGTAFVPDKVNSQPGEAGSLWEKMYFYYQFRRDEFLKHYHQRSNMESTFSMVKAKFRDHMRSKTDVAMTNEVLCKFLCHNICVVHHSHIELGIAPLFWRDQPQLADRGNSKPAVCPAGMPPGGAYPAQAAGRIGPPRNLQDN
jgi:hypothetical protein